MTRKNLLSFLGIILGTLLAAMGLVLFLIPNKIAAGGVSGLATVIFYVTGFPPGMTMLALNIPLFILALRIMGIPFLFRTFFGAVALSVAIDLLTLVLKPFTVDPLLSAVYGGLLMGAGLGVVARSGGSTGGTDLAARILHRYAHLSIGQSLMLVDTLVIVAAGIVFNLELALYGLLSLFVTTRVLDAIQEGFSSAKAAFIISEKSDLIAKRVMEEMHRGVTALSGKGLYTGLERVTLLCVVSRTEITQLKMVVAQVDPKAFVILSDVKEVLGEGFKENLI